MKKQLILSVATILLLVSCGNKNNDESISDDASSYDWMISFVSNGGNEVSPIKVKDGEVASKPKDPSKDGYIFQDWFVDSCLTITFDWETKITSNWTLYASWKEDENKQSSSEENQSSSEEEISSEEKETNGHGPEGSSLTSWYLVGSGSLWDSSNGWTIAGGVQLYTNPSNLNDKGCILGLSMQSGDTFKVTDGKNTWFGYEGVDTSSSSSNKGITNFVGLSDGYGGQNFKCTVSGTYDMYVNSSGKFWIQNSN